MEKFINTEDGLALWTEAFGNVSGHPVLLIMGAMNQGIFWPDDFCEGLAQAGFYVIRYDHRDTGKSSTVDFQLHPYDLNVLASDAVAVLGGYGFKQAAIVGLSMGGYIAQLVAINYPEIVDRMVLISTTADHRPYMAATMGQVGVSYALPGPGKELLDYIKATAANPPQTAKEIEENLLTGWEVTYGGDRPFPQRQLTQALRLAAQRSSHQSAAFNHALAVEASPDRLESVRQIHARTLIIHGRYDICLPLKHGEYLACNIAGSQLKVLEMGHTFMWSWTGEVLDYVLKFLGD